MKKLKIILFILIAPLLLLACNNDENSSNKENEITNNEQEVSSETSEVSETEDSEPVAEEDIEAEPLPSTYEELANQPVGELADFNPSNTEPEKTLEAFKDLPDISNNPSQTELDHYYRTLLSMVQDQFTGPEQLMRKLKFEALGDPEIEDTRYQLKEHLNVMIVLDASGSMAADAKGTPKMTAAKETITKFVQSLPEGAKVGLRVYGHEGSSSNEDKQLSCSSSDIVYQVNSYDQNTFNQALESIQPNGWTPTGLALKEAQNDLAQMSGENNTNIIYLVSDGVSTCEDNPVEAAKNLYNSNISPIINVIGFDVDAEGQNELIEIANETEGIYQKVNDQSELEKEFDRVKDLAETWQNWKDQSQTKLERKQVQNDLSIFSYITTEESTATYQRSDIDTILFNFKEEEKMDRDSYDYLKSKNKEFHDWVKKEIEDFKLQLEDLNNQSFSEALNALEEKYQTNAQ
ncbi:vWA domain-containing protein [Bacillus mesophilum]|uniref:VWA domain-containing protein n=1 Tax=Bacillus mesophilum TaxID=1071718 RepID=A0A7V7UTS1_9BACI|nr:VWA domain-containing protein [Bacillus mesophilum]KAB2330083.1 VWA domain-containing protein [Bacillus mesophilum]